MSTVIHTVIGTVVVLLCLWQWSWWYAVLSTAIFLLAYTASDSFLRYADEIPDLFSSKSQTALCRRRRKTSPESCDICGLDNCKRGKGNACELEASQTSGCVLDPKIPKIVDDALHEFFDLTLRTYVDSWYETFISCEDKSFVKQLRIHLRYSLCRVFQRISSVNLSHVILDEILPVAVNHAAIYAETKRNHSEFDGDALEECVLKRMSSMNMLHPAMKSRQSEISYLKRLVDYLITHFGDKTLSPATFVFLRELLTFEVCLPAADAVADPDIVNRLLELFFDPAPLRPCESELSEKVSLLKRFVDEKNSASSPDTVVFQIKLSEIIRDPPMLYIFMNYLKSIHAPMNWLQFILSTHDIQEKLHSGRNLSREDISHLHWQSWELYRNYLHEGAPDKLDDDMIPSEIIKELRLGVEADPEQAMTIIGQVLEQAYQIVYQQLQWRYVTSFCQSDKFMELICDSRQLEESKENDVPELADDDTMVNPTVAQNHAYLLQESIDEALGGCNSGASGSGSGSDEDDGVALQQENVLAVESIMPGPLKDLSQWKVCLPRIEPRRDIQTGRTMYVYVVEIETTMDSGVRRWMVDRRYKEFYILESKLVEFHGEQVLGGFPLPPKKTFNNKSRAFLESQRPIFDQFLKRLLHNPALKGSELLYTFLTSTSELTVSFLPDPFKVMRKVPGKLSRERGQNLTSFLQSLASSVLKSAPSNDLKVPENSGRSSPYPVGRASPSISSISASPRHKSVQEKIYNTHYKNNFDMVHRSASYASTGKLEDLATFKSIYSHQSCVIKGVYDSLIFLAHKVFQISFLSFTVLVSFRNVIRRSFDGYVFRFLERQLKDAMHEENLVVVIHALRDVIFLDDISQRNDEDKKQRKENAFSLAKMYLDTELSLIKQFVGCNCFDEGLKIIFHCLQHPRLNKQLFYVLLDVVTREIFPQLP